MLKREPIDIDAAAYVAIMCCRGYCTVLRTVVAREILIVIEKQEKTHKIRGAQCALDALGIV